MPKPRRGRDTNQRGNQFLRDTYYNHDDRGDRRVTFKSKRRYDKRGGFSIARGRAFNSDIDMREGASDFIGAVRNKSNLRKSRPRNLQPSPRTNSNWCHITVFQGGRYDKEFILENLKNAARIDFIPYSYQTEGVHVVFYVDSIEIGLAIKRANKLIQCPDGFTLSIKVLTHHLPPVVPLDATIKTLISQVMGRRFNAATKALDLSNFSSDIDFKTSGSYVSLTRKNVMEAVMNTIKENISQLEGLDISNNGLHSLDGLENWRVIMPNLKVLYCSNNKIYSDGLPKIKKMPLVEICLTGNPIIKSFKDEASYIGSLRQLFPKLLKLDNIDLPPIVGFDFDEEEPPLPPSKSGYFADNHSKGLVLQFVQEYFRIYDSDDRSALLDAYHDNAIFSLSSAYPSGSTNITNAKLSPYFGLGRNLKKIVSFSDRQNRLKHGKHAVVAALMTLPKTKHDPISFTVDITLVCPQMIAFTLTGVFREPDEKYPPTRSFMRTYTLVPVGAGFCITNEIYFITNASSEQVKMAFRTPAPTPSHSPVSSTSVNPSPLTSASSPPVTSPEDFKTRLVTNFCNDSGMNREWSLKCLEENDWDYLKAGEVFTQLKMINKIPAEAFVKFC